MLIATLGGLYWDPDFADTETGIWKLSFVCPRPHIMSCRIKF